MGQVTLEETVDFKFGGCGGNVMVGATKRSVRHQVRGGVSRVTVKSVPIFMGKINALKCRCAPADGQCIQSLAFEAAPANVPTSWMERTRDKAK